jgi:hypothetical protein
MPTAKAHFHCAMAYDTDLYDWSLTQADALRRRAWNELDVDNIAEEIESLGRSDRREIGSRLVILLTHLLKWKYQPEHQSPSWRASIYEARTQIEQLIEESPSLRSYPAERLTKAYAMACQKASIETGMPDLPAACPWPIDQILDAEFLPD